jgi:uptake hydrogenase large subunit
MRFVVGPFNRVEGDLEVTLDIADGVVASARVTAPLYRGFENLMLGRPLFDALVMVPRICGICSVSQSAAAVAALADLSGASMPRNGRLASNLILGSEVLLDHLTHFYLFFMPDFARVEYAQQPWYHEVEKRFRAQKGSAMSDFLPARARFLTVLGLLAGKWPHTLALRPSGTTRPVHGGERFRLQALLREFRSFLEAQFFADTLENVAGLDSPSQLETWTAAHQAKGDWARFLWLAEALGLPAVGRSGAQLLSSGAYPESAESGGRALFQSGATRNFLQVEAFDPAAIAEDHSHGWFNASANPLAPADGETRPNAERGEGYTWCKAPRYLGAPAEVGAFARQVIDRQPLLVALAAQEGANARSRVVARGIEVARLLLAMESWARALDEQAPFHQDETPVASGHGVGFVEAARGTLGHWLHAENGKIKRYQIVAPTTWNFSPRDAAGTPGPLETALAGLPVTQGKPGPLVQHVVRSFDPCLACTVH